MLKLLLFFIFCSNAFANYATRPKGGPFTSVTDEFGPLTVRAGNFLVEANIKPWSSWWFPLTDDYLFQARNGENSPLQRYDAYVLAKTGSNPDSAGFERTNLYQPQADAWAGLCDAWALASIMMPEPTAPITAEGVSFRIGDLKALALKTYENVDGLKMYGQRNDGNWDSVYEDIYPEQLHKFMQIELFQNIEPFIIDYDPGIQVWSAPVWKAQTILTLDAGQKIMHVTTLLFTASSLVQIFDFVGTDELVRQYTYDLFGTIQTDGSFAVDYGEWTDRSQWDHPDYAIARPTTVVRKSRNLKIDVEMVDQILAGK